MRYLLLPTLMALAACSVERDTDIAVGEVDTSAVELDASEPAPTAPADQTPPIGSDTYIARGVCPFECCTYRQWTLETPATVRTAPAAGASEAFALPAGSVVRADSGNVHVLRPGIVVADRAFPVAETAGAPSVAAGDTLYLLDTMGEGYLHTRYRGRIYETSGAAWFGGGPPGSTPAARLVREAETEWWVHVTLSDARTGWIMMDDVRVDGADACA